MVTCGRFTRSAVVIMLAPSATAIGRRVVLAKVGIMETRKPEDIAWCQECGRYYNPMVSHACVDVKIKSDQRALERWLGRWKIQEEVNDGSRAGDNP